MGLPMTMFAWLHIFFATGWIGGGLFSSVALSPTLRGISPEAAVEFVGKFMPKLGKMMGLFSSLTMVFGVGLLFEYTGGQPLELATLKEPEIFILSGAILGFCTYIFGIAIMLPQARNVEKAVRTSRSESGEENYSKISGLMTRLEKLALVDLVLLLAVFTLMIFTAFY
jgi:uncharacterized membrane protein